MPEFTNLPVIVLSNLGDLSVISKMVDLGITDYLVKSDYGLAKIISKVRAVLNE